MIDAESIYDLIGKKIKEKRKAANFTQAKLAEAIDVSRASLANYESANTSIYISDLYHIAEHLDSDISEFLPSMEEIRESTSYEKNLEKKNVNSEKKREILEFIESVKEEDNG